MVERMNCTQNQNTIANKSLLRNKTAGFIITGGQDNIQGTAGQMLGFFSELGVQFPQYPYVAHSRGWNAEDMENNIRAVAEGKALREAARGLVITQSFNRQPQLWTRPNLSNFHTVIRPNSLKATHCPIRKGWGFYYDKIGLDLFS